MTSIVIAAATLACVVGVAAFAHAQTFDTKLVPADLAAFDRFGDALAVDGNDLVVGTCFSDAAGFDSGAVYAYERIGGVWTQTAKLLANDTVAGDRFGSSVALSGTRLVVGAPGRYNASGEQCGAVYVFVKIAGAWQQSAKLFPSDGGVGAEFGATVDTDFTRIAVGAPLAEGITFVVHPGAVYVFDLFQGTWLESGKIVETAQGQDWDGFGSSLDLSGDRILAGAPLAYDGGNLRGRAQICENTVFGWDVVHTLHPAQVPIDNWHYGSAVALDGDRAIVTSRFGGPVGGYYIPGIADVWETVTGASWTLKERIAPAAVDLDDLENGIGFGGSVDLDGDTFVVGSRDADQNGDARGAVWVYRKTLAGWVETDKLVAPDSALGDSFSAAVAVQGTTLVAGAVNDDDKGLNSGTAWALTIPAGLTDDFVGTPAYLDPCGAACGAPNFQTLAIDVGPAFGGATYIVLGSVTGEAPGVQVGSLHLPLNIDAYTLYTTLAPFAGPLVPGAGTLDPQGQALLAFQLPPNLSQYPLTGVSVTHAAIILDPVFGSIAYATQATHFTFTP